MKSGTIRRFTYFLLLAVAYTSCLLQWLWVTIVALPPILESGALDVIMLTPTDSSPPAPTLMPEQSPILWIIVGVVTLVILVMTVVVLIRIPKILVRSGEYVVHQTTEATVPLITHHRSLPAKQRRVISRRVRLAVQSLLVATPLIISWLLPSYGQITREIIVLIGLWLALFSAVGFAAAWLLGAKANPTSRTQSHASRG